MINVQIDISEALVPFVSPKNKREQLLRNSAECNDNFSVHPKSVMRRSM